MSRNSVLVIPSLNPDKKLLDYVRCLIENGFKKIIVVDDGSSPASKHVFDSVRVFPECEILTHAVNMGKGRALKDAFNLYCQKYRETYSGVITVDSDGQHTVEDVIKLDAALNENHGELILGVRNFDESQVPFKSRFGNKLTKQIMQFLIGRPNKAGMPSQSAGWGISDTQTGLRAIPNQQIIRYLTLFGERFEYETSMLIDAVHMHTPIREIPIKTVYINENKETHFRPVADSAAIYRLIFATFFRYSAVSVSSFLIDYGIFRALIFLMRSTELAIRIWTASFAARLISSFYNYVLNRAVVFRDCSAPQKTMAWYYVLCMVQLCCSALAVWAGCWLTGLSESFVKPFADAALFLISFQIQREWIFKGGMRDADSKI